MILETPQLNYEIGEDDVDAGSVRRADDGAAAVVGRCVRANAMHVHVLMCGDCRGRISSFQRRKSLALRGCEGAACARDAVFS